MLLFDPELASATRASAHSLNVVFVDELTEGRLQLNLCDVASIARIAQLVGSGCDSTGLLLMLAGPFNDKQAVDLLDFQYLGGRFLGTFVVNAGLPVFIAIGLLLGTSCRTGR